MNNPLVIHAIAETVVISGVAYYLNNEIAKLKSEIDDLKSLLEQSNRNVKAVTLHFTNQIKKINNENSKIIKARKNARTLLASPIENDDIKITEIPIPSEKNVKSSSKIPEITLDEDESNSVDEDVEEQLSEEEEDVDQLLKNKAK